MECDELPAGWVRCQLGDITMSIDKIDQKQEPDREIAYIDISGIDNESNRIVETKRYTLEEAPSRARQIVKAGDTVFSTVRPYLRNIALVPDKLDNEIASTGFSVIRGANGVEPLFLFFLATSQSFVDALTRVQYGASYPAVKDTQVKSQPLLLPPFPEQQRIVEKIETLFAELDKGEEALREVQKLLARYRQSVLKAAVTGTLTADWRAANGPPKETGKDLLARILKARRETWQGRGKYQEALEPDTDGLPELPNGWVWASMDQLLGHLTSGSRDWKQYYGEGTGTFIMAQNVRPMRFDLTERFLVNPPPGSPDAVRSQVRLDDLLITIVGANTGDVCRFPLDVDEHYVCQSVALMRLVEPDLSRFVELYLSGKGAGRDQLEKHIYGAGRPHLSFEQLRSIAVPLPPNDEREELMVIVNETLSNLEHVRSACNAEAKRSAGLRQSVLKAAFSGKLVSQDPSDEPADKLLERIRTARAEKPKAKRKKVYA